MPASVAARHVAASRAGSRTVAAGSTHDRRARWAAQATGCVGGGSISGQSGRLATSQAYCSLAYRRTSPGSTRRSGMGREGEAVSPSVEALRIGSLCSVNRHSSMTKPHGAPQATGMGAPARSSRAAMAPVTRPAVSHSAAVTNDTNSDRSMQREWSTPRNRLASRSCLADSVTTWPACAANWAAVPSPPGSSARVTPYRSTASTIRSMASETCSRAWDGGTRATAVHAAASGSIWARKERPAAAAAADGACSSTCCVRALLDVGTTPGDRPAAVVPDPAGVGLELGHHVPVDQRAHHAVGAAHRLRVDVQEALLGRDGVAAVRRLLEAVQQPLEQAGGRRERRQHAEGALVQALRMGLLPVEEHHDAVSKAQRHLGPGHSAPPVSNGPVAGDVGQRADVAMGADVPLEVGQKDDLPTPLGHPHGALNHQAVSGLKQVQPRIGAQLDVGIVEEDGAHRPFGRRAEVRLKGARLVDLEPLARLLGKLRPTRQVSSQVVHAVLLLLSGSPM
eukprot:scaffold1124_cov131-Isochrysis_galbana.AAC.8